MPPTALPPITLPLARYRFTARLAGELQLPPFAGSMLRGVFGAALRRTACMTGLPQCPACPLWQSCPYPALFECPPQQTQLGQKFSQVPNPYVIEPPPLGTLRLAPSEPLVFHMVLVGEPSLRQLPLVVHAWQRALREGLGHARTQAKLVSVEWLPEHAEENPVTVLAVTSENEASSVLQPHAPAWHWPSPTALEAQAGGCLRLNFHTPLRLQNNGRALGPQQLQARTLFSQMLRRISLMLELHMGVCPAPFDATTLLAGLQDTVEDRSRLLWQDWMRYSSRQKQEMHLGGVLGQWTLHGAGLKPLLPWLSLAQPLHLGKNATLGMGSFTWEWLPI